jgi:hypothetical protein
MTGYNDSSSETSQGLGTHVSADQRSGRSAISYAGIIFIYLSALIFISVVAALYFHKTLVGEAKIISDFTPEFLLSAIALTTALLGVGLLKAAGLSESSPNMVINPKEWDVLSQELKGGSEEAISQYIRLTSLTGFTGTFTKLGLSGLPLATIGLTLFFSLLFLKNAAYLDLAKLTLGAFIGSFVQKQVSASQNSGTVRLPSGEKVKVSGASNPLT